MVDDGCYYKETEEQKAQIKAIKDHIASVWVNHTTEFFDINYLKKAFNDLIPNYQKFGKWSGKSFKSLGSWAFEKFKPIFIRDFNEGYRFSDLLSYHAIDMTRIDQGREVRQKGPILIDDRDDTFHFINVRNSIGEQMVREYLQIDFEDLFIETTYIRGNKIKSTE
jgi:hypothetical protein